MLTDEKKMWGKLLAETYRLQRRLKPEMTEVDDAKIYGLLHGIEHVVDEELTNITGLSRANFEMIEKYLLAMVDLEEDKKPLKSYYDMERALASSGVTRTDFMLALEYLKARDDGFWQVAEKMIKLGSPIEMQGLGMSALQK